MQRDSAGCPTLFTQPIPKPRVPHPSRILRRVGCKPPAPPSPAFPLSPHIKPRVPHPSRILRRVGCKPPAPPSPAFPLSPHIKPRVPHPSRILRRVGCKPPAPPSPAFPLSPHVKPRVPHPSRILRRVGCKPLEHHVVPPFQTKSTKVKKLRREVSVSLQRFTCFRAQAARRQSTLRYSSVRFAPHPSTTSVTLAARSYW
jgi:hypothetical protein